MNPAASSPNALSAAASQELVLRRLDEARGVLDAGPCGPLLDYEGINLFDAVLAEMNLMMLAVLRHKPADGSPVTRPASAARRLAYRWRQDLAARAPHTSRLHWRPRTC